MFPPTQPSTGLNNWQYGYYVGGSGSQLILDPSTYGLLSPTPQYDTNTPANLTGGNAGWYSKNFYQYWTTLDAFGGHPNANYTDLHQAPYCDGALYQNCGNGPDPRSPNSPDSGQFWDTRRYIVPSGFTGNAFITLAGEKDPRTAGANAQGITDFIVLVRNGAPTVIGCLNVPVNGVTSPTVNYASCAQPGVTPDPLGSNQPIYSTTASDFVQPGDFLDFVMVPNFQTNVPGTNGAQAYADYSSGSFQLITINGVPEPASLGLMGGGLLLLGILRRRSLV